MFECPICHKLGISSWSKACTGSAWPTKCKQCGKKVGVPYSSLLYAIPFFIASAYFEIARMNFVSIFAVVAALVFYFVMHIKYVPLIPKEF